MREAKKLLEIFFNNKRCKEKSLIRMMQGKKPNFKKVKVGSKGRVCRIEKLNTVLTQRIDQQKNLQGGNKFLNNPNYTSPNILKISSNEILLRQCQDKIRSLILKKLSVSQSNPTLSLNINTSLDAYVNVIIENLQRTRAITISEMVLLLNQNFDPIETNDLYFEQIKKEIIKYLQKKKL
ncbi:hypothetical protein M0813_13634 [Anaeramoeba flamelloides]|uniref:Uncharacterized protein n=1 Tax=Anaeramoeba flamelloides TaxID=1746091 RepID=A0ABQ8Z7R4_9EUKA|nr:hypothetical protein M0813_13634 [Anaeramoeba flamelloides]